MTSPATHPNPLEQVPLERLRERTSIKWRHFGPEVLPMWVAEMDVVPADAIQDAIARAMRDGDTGYARGVDYAEAHARFSADRWGFAPDPAASVTVADVMTGIFELIRMLTDLGDEVVVTSPVYPPFHGYTMHAGRVVREAPLTAAGRLDVDAIDAALAAATAGGRRSVLLLASPHNPTGTVHTRAELEAVAAIAARHGASVVVDEIHAPLALPGAVFTPYLSVDPRGFVVTSASKAWNLAGIRSATILAGTDAAATLRAFPEVVTHGPNHLAVIAHTAAYDHGRDWLDAVVVGIAANHALLRELLAGSGVEHRIPEATYLAWLDLSATAIADPDARAAGGDVTATSAPSIALQRAGLGVNAGEPFGAGGANHVRVNVGTSQAVLREGVARLRSAVGPA
ncbi:MalY/PatB family protein [Agrococcus jejuensis]|uniref:cysteine-S-conjugate beta-lyase n=1 Tax=Agrococcus jejuensis TaxID=399736 RepID=A0A1G8CPH4_9MICO|nr:aminotransferase class I/II-fold pyridoxal phosphate-dependent enzyme [Agrococcus jejuensis]SDH47447.1 cystathione beta-lyase [Agrococcus jejuensis]